jgi:NADH-quinone oxidoreductase subunit C
MLHNKRGGGRSQHERPERLRHSLVSSFNDQLSVICAMTGADLLNSLGQLLGSKIRDKIEFRGEMTYTISPEDLREVAKFCRDELSFDYLIDITSVDNSGQDPRFEIVYELYSMTLAVHLRLKLAMAEEMAAVDTVSDIWATANWHEREIYDMMGIKFNGHPDLRRILMWDGYPYFPLRKEFPLEGLVSDMPDVAFTRSAPLEGGPFVTRPSTATTKDREPRSRAPEL